MSSWRDACLLQFTPQLARIVLARDPDRLLLEEGIQQEINTRGYEVITYEDAITFRFAFESRYRSMWDRGEASDRSTVIRWETGDIPYDLLSAGPILAFSLADLFPRLSYKVVSGLNRADLDIVYSAQNDLKPNKLGDNATKDFVLLHVFQFAPELINDPIDFLRFALRAHYLNRHMSADIQERVAQVLSKKEELQGWPIKDLTSDREFFLSFLQERWAVFLDKIAKETGTAIKEPPAVYDLRIPGPAEIPFDQPDIRVYIDTMFMDGWLKPVKHPVGTALATGWIITGIKRDPEEDRRLRLEKLLADLSKKIPGPGDSHETWLTFAPRWAQAIVLRHQLQLANLELSDRFTELQSKVDAVFLDWLQSRFAGLYHQPAMNPVMVHHIPRTLALYRHNQSETKVALVVVDGLSLDQWIVLRDELLEQRQDFLLREGAAFAWIPTITSVSRQSIFAGSAPLYFPASVFTTDKEPNLWVKFWIERGLEPRQVDYIRSVGSVGSLQTVEDKASHPKLVSLGLVVDQVDNIMHGMTLGTAGMHNQVRQWAKEGTFARLLDILWQYGFQVFLTSDHGNIEASGCGRPTEGSAAEVAGERARVYPDKLLRSHVKHTFPESLEWAPTGLPPDFFPLISARRTAFVPLRDRRVAHGGASIEEVIVPFVCLERRSHAT